MNIFEVIFYQPIYNIVGVFYHLLGDNLGLAIIAIGIVSRTVLIPLTLRQIKFAESSREFSEKSKEVKNKFKNNKEKQQEELLKLQREYLPAQLSGCLPLIFQLIIFLNIYSIIRNLISNGAAGFNEVAYAFVPQINETISGDFLGILNLKTTPSQAGSDILPYLILLVLVGITQYFSMRILTGIRQKRQAKLEADKPKKKKEKKQKKADEPESFEEIMQRSTKQVMFIFPFLLMFISYNLPAGLSIYLITTSLFVILQQSVYFYFEERKKPKEE